jgi:RimJ/RimL family protein N-acetyltransferase
MLDRPLDDTFHEASSPVLETERLVLRAPRFEDAKPVAALAGDRRVAENTSRIPHPYSLADAKDWIGSVNRTAGEASYLIDSGGEVIGGCGLELCKGLPEIGYWLGVPFWGNGYATEAVRALIDHAFGEHGYPALHAGARVSNPASRRVLEKCGFQWTGVGLCRIRAIRSSVPLDRFRLERGVWASLKSPGRNGGEHGAASADAEIHLWQKRRNVSKSFWWFAKSLCPAIGRIAGKHFAAGRFLPSESHQLAELILGDPTSKPIMRDK